MNAASGASPVSGLAGCFRKGQVFLTWREADTPPGTTFSAYSHSRPIRAGELEHAQCLARRIEPHSARDWWQDPASFDAKAAAGAPVGFRIQSHAGALTPDSGLFVHTVGPEDEGPRYYAVTAVPPGDGTREAVEIGTNSLATPVAGRVELTQPIWQAEGEPPAAGSGHGFSLILHLHGRGEGVTAGPNARPANSLVFGDARQGWREGMAFKFDVRVSPGLVAITPHDRAWTGGRRVTESWDERDHCPAVNTFWYGYHRDIAETTQTAEAVVPNYTEEYLLWLMRWAQEHLGADPDRTYLCGTSMGGSGAVAMALHHPERVAAVIANVPVYAFTRPGHGTAIRLECVCGPLERPAFTNGGRPLLEHMNGIVQVERATADLPFMVTTNGRQDRSIPWENNPSFYQAMGRARQGFMVYWNNGGHEMNRDAPPDHRAWAWQLDRFTLKTSFPAFSNCSSDRDPGNGDPADGDLEGWINRGMDWTDIIDERDEYALTVTADYPGLERPVTVDITPRRLQAFRPAAGERLGVEVDGSPAADVVVPPGGRFTIPRVRIASVSGVRVRVQRSGSGRTATP